MTNSWKDEFKILNRVAIRNLMRNPRRTLLSCLAISTGLAASMFSDSVTKGMIDSMIRTTTHTYLGHIQIHHLMYRDSGEIEHTIPNLKEAIAVLESRSEKLRFSERALSFAMISSSADVSNGMLVGIRSENEPQVSKLKAALIEGNFLSPRELTRKSKREILVGKELSDRLKAEVGDRIVVTLAQKNTGELAQELFRVAGIFKFNIREMDQNLFFTHFDTARKMMNLENEAHEIAVLALDDREYETVLSQIKLELQNKNLEILSWKELLPQLVAVISMSDYSLLIVASILFVLIALAIMNTLFMAIFERRYELGMLRAIGTRKSFLAKMILFESAYMAGLASFLGILLGSLILGYFSQAGIDYSGVEFSGVTLNDPIYTRFELDYFTVYPVVVFVLSIFISLYPAWIATQTSPIAQKGDI